MSDDTASAFDSLRKAIGHSRVMFCLGTAWELFRQGRDKDGDAWLDQADENARDYGVAWEQKK